MSTFILVSGAWHAAWCWERVIPLLEAEGHRVVAPDLIGMGPDSANLAFASLASWADQIATIVCQQNEPVVLVGHSRGGIIISEVAERVPERIATLVYLTAFLVESGETLLNTSTKIIRRGSANYLVPKGDGSAIVRRDAIGPTFYNTTEPFWVERAESLLTPEPISVLTTPLCLTAERYGSVRRSYIECEQDNAISLDLQRLMQMSLPCQPVLALKTDHSPFYSAPDQLADYLCRII